MQCPNYGKLTTTDNASSVFNALSAGNGQLLKMSDFLFLLFGPIPAHNLVTQSEGWNANT